MNAAGAGGYFFTSGNPGIKSIQRGTIAITGATSNTATITSVDTANALIRYCGQKTSVAGSAISQAQVRIALTNATTATASVGNSPGAATTTASYEVLERNPGLLKLVQRGTIANTGTATITSVNTARAALEFLGWNQVGGDTVDWNPLQTLTNATTVTQTCNSGGASTTGGYQVAEENV